MHKAILFDKLHGERARCKVCNWRCTVAEGKWGHCQTRVNKGGNLYSAIYGMVASIAVSPIEKKPVFHFLPGSSWLSLGTYGCNFRCPGCQNWELSHAQITQRLPTAKYISPESLVELAKEHKCDGISWTYNEPTIWLEYTIDGARLAKEAGLFTNYVTNGYITQEALDTIGPYLNIFRVDIKGVSSEAYMKLAKIRDFSPILEATVRAKDKWGMHVECVTNITPTVNDDRKQLTGIARWIAKELGVETPWHVTQFVPHYDWSDYDLTPVAKLEEARKIGQEAGLKYVYVGNVPGHPGESTYCPQCGNVLIERDGLAIRNYNLDKNRCPSCGSTIWGKFYES